MRDAREYLFDDEMVAIGNILDAMSGTELMFPEPFSVYGADEKLLGVISEHPDDASSLVFTMATLHNKNKK